jgi:hypothetical protein
MEKRTTKPILESILGEGNMNLNLNATVTARIDNESFMKLFAVLVLAGVILFAMWFMFMYLFKND